MNRAQKIAIGLVVGVPVVGLLGGYVALSKWMSNESGNLQGDLAELRRQGLPTEPSHLATLPLSSPKNAAALYREAIEMKARPGYALAIKAISAGQAPKASPEEIEAARAAFPKIAPIVAKIEEAADRPECNFNREYAKGFEVVFPEFADLKNFSRILCLKAELQSADGDASGTLKSLTRAQSIDRHSGTEPVLIGMLVRIAGESITHRTLRKILLEHPNDPKFHAAIAQTLATAGPLPSMRYYLSGEMVLGRVGIQRIKDLRDVVGDQNTPGLDRVVMSPPLRTAVESHYVHEYRKMIPQIPKDPRDWKTSLEVMKRFDEELQLDKSPVGRVTQLIFPIYSQAAQAIGKLEAERRLTSTMLELVIARSKGKLPKQLVAAESHKDPLGTGLLHYQVKGNGFKLYSEGPDGRDSGGVANYSDAENGYDLVVEVP